jgi:hypothetical protein
MPFWVAVPLIAAAVVFFGWLAWRYLISPAYDRYDNNNDHPLG